MFKLKTKREKKRLLTVLLLLLLFLFLMFIGTHYISVFSGKFYLSNPVFHLLLSLNILLLLLVFVFLIRNIFLLFIPQRTTRLRFKLVTAFSLLILGPSLFAVILSTGFINRGLDRLFRLHMKKSIETAFSTADSAVNLLTEDIISRLKKIDSVGSTPLKKENFSGLCVIGEKKVYCRGDVKVDRDVVKKVLEIERFYRRLDKKKREITVCMEKKPGLIYCGSRKLPQEFVNNIIELTKLNEDYTNLRTYEKPIRGIYTATFLTMALLVLTGAFWFSRYFEKRINTPVEALYRATRKISKGNFDVKVEAQGTDELKNVIDAFNYMVEQLRGLTKRLESEKEYVERIINSISPALISVSKEWKLISFNTSAVKIFKNMKENDYFGKHLEKYPEIDEAIKDLVMNGGGKKEVSEAVDGKERVLSVEVIPFKDIEGIVIIIEDLTKIVRAQKISAWREVAQRLAHEIKNPLTPISLSAERIRRLLTKENVSVGFAAAVDKATSLILEEVEIIRRLIDEFRMFARLPLPEKQFEDLNDLIEKYSGLYGDRVKIEFEFGELPPTPVDKKLLREVFLNLVENSIDAGATKIKIKTEYKDGKIFMVFRDNGSGVPDEIKEKIFSPHISTKRKGWGLGLAISKRIIEDHGGKIYLADNNTFVVELPV